MPWLPLSIVPHVAGYGVRLWRAVLKPQAVNLGMKLGPAAGAGILEDVQRHIVPRGEGDTSYMTVLSGTRVISKALEENCERFRATMATMPFRS